MSKAWIVTVKNLKFRFREPQQWLFMFGFPLMFVLLFGFMFKDMPYEGSPNTGMFGVFIWGLLGFSTAFAVQSAAVAFSQEKDTGTIKRLLTTPVGSTNSIFVGFILSELLVIAIQIAFVYVLAFLVLQTYVSSVGALIVNFGMYMLLAVVCIGIGLILAALLNPKLAGQLPMIVVMPIVFLSGSFVPLGDTPILYANPVFWAQQFATDLGLWGNGLGDTIKLADYMTGGTIDTGIAVGLSIPIMIGFAAAFLMIGLLLFKKTLQE